MLFKHVTFMTARRVGYKINVSIQANNEVVCKLEVLVKPQRCHIDHYLSFDIPSDQPSRTLNLLGIAPTDSLKVYSSDPENANASLEGTDLSLVVKPTTAKKEISLFFYADNF